MGESSDKKCFLKQYKVRWGTFSKSVPYLSWSLVFVVVSGCMSNSLAIILHQPSSIRYQFQSVSELLKLVSSNKCNLGMSESSAEDIIEIVDRFGNDGIRKVINTNSSVKLFTNPSDVVRFVTDMYHDCNVAIIWNLEFPTYLNLSCDIARIRVEHTVKYNFAQWYQRNLPKRIKLKLGSMNMETVPDRIVKLLTENNKYNNNCAKKLNDIKALKFGQLEDCFYLLLVGAMSALLCFLLHHIIYCIKMKFCNDWSTKLSIP